MTYQEMRPSAQVERHYVEAMAARGLRVVSRQEQAGGVLLEFAGDRGRTRVTLLPYVDQLPGTGILVQATGNEE